MELTREHLNEIYDHARAAWPEECCGYVAPGGAVVRCTNVASDLHRRDPDGNPRDGRTAYVIAAREQLALDRALGAGGVIYHSHCEFGSYFSDTDVARATFDGEPIYPGVEYLVVSVVQREIKDARQFAWSDGARSFPEVRRYAL